MFLVIKTQHLENYGRFDEPPKPRWKPKGGDIFVIYGAKPRDTSVNNFIAKECVKNDGGFCTYPVDSIIDVPSGNSFNGNNTYNWVADEVDYPWFKFVNIKGPNEWDINSISVDENQYDYVEKVRIAEVIKLLTEECNDKTTDR